MARKLTSALCLALGLGATSLAQAGFIGKTVTGEHLFPDISTALETSSAVVTALTEFSFFTGFPIYTVNVGDTNLLIQMVDAATWNSGSGITFNGFHLFDTNGTIDAISAVTIDVNNWSGFDGSRISFDANNIWVDMQSLDFDKQTSLLLNVEFATTQPPNPTPEPATLALLGLGLVGLGALRRKA